MRSIWRIRSRLRFIAPHNGFRKKSNLASRRNSAVAQYPWLPTLWRDVLESLTRITFDFLIWRSPQRERSNTNYRWPVDLDTSKRRRHQTSYE